MEQLRTEHETEELSLLIEDDKNRLVQKLDCKGL